ncbi:MAG: MFS transporter [Phycisphaeraceae bacterium]|nr:MFS transporter [Phycisphaeraceae bacterium]
MAAARRWYPGYTVAGVSTLAFIATAPGQTFIISQFNTPLRDAFGIGELTLNVAYTVATVLASLPLVLVGSMTDRLGPRRALALVALLFGLSCAAMGLASGAISVFVGFFLLRFLGQGALSLVSQHALAMWFHRRLGAIHGVKQVVIFGVWVPFPFLASWLIEQAGWRLAFVVLGALVCATVIPLSLWLVRDRPEDLGLRIDNDPAPDGSGATNAHEPGFTLRQARRTRAFWIIAAAFFVSPLIGTAFLFDIQPILAQRGMTPTHAAAAVSVWTLSMSAMALPSGFLTDRLRPAALMSAGMGLIALSAVALWAASAPWGASLALGLFGVGQSLVATSGNAAIARSYGRAHHGAIRASVARLAVIGTGLGSTFTGLSAALTGGYALAMILFVAMAVPVSIACATLAAPAPPPPSDDPG